MQPIDQLRTHTAVYRYGRSRHPGRRRSGASKAVVIIGVLAGGGILLALACCGGALYLFKTPAPSAAAQQPFAFAEVPLPAFPERGEPDELEPGVLQYTIALGDDNDGLYDTPGHGGAMYLYLPAGEHAPKSLPCILITGAGSTMLAGMTIGEGDQPEHLPYVKAGCAVLAYELDGEDSGEDPQAMAKAFEAFKASRAGLVNGRNALEYVLNKVPEANPKQIFAAGHSSAATHALLFAEHEPRLAGVIAYAPATDLPKSFEDELQIFRFLLPGCIDFITQSSPTTHVARLKCPTFLFHAEDDLTCEIAQTRAFYELLKQHGGEVTLKTVATGDHYDSMIEAGIPAGIEWLRERGALQAAPNP